MSESQEIETQQEVITSLTLRLREREGENENLKQILKSSISVVSCHSDQGLEDIQTTSTLETSMPTTSEDIGMYDTE